MVVEHHVGQERVEQPPERAHGGPQETGVVPLDVLGRRTSLCPVSGPESVLSVGVLVSATGEETSPGPCTLTGTE